MSQRQTPYIVGILAITMATLFVACRSVPHTDTVPTLTIEQIKSSADGSHSGQVRLQGVVTIVNLNFGFFVVQDKTAGIHIQSSQFAETSLEGHRVEIAGTTPIGVVDRRK